MRAQKRDENEGDIIAAFKQLGCKCEQIPGGNGRPDLVVYDPATERNYWVEVKKPGGKLNDLQVKWRAKWPGDTDIVDSVMGAAALVYKWRAGHVS